MPLTPENDRCHFTYADGRRCRMPKLPSHPELCYEHWHRIEQDDETQRASHEILNEHIQLDTAVGVNRALTNVFRLASQQRISAKYASSLAYIGHLLLCTLPHIERESAKLTEEMKQQLRRYLDNPDSLSQDERQFWDNFINNRTMYAVDGNFAKRIDQIQYLDEQWKDSLNARKRGRPRKVSAPGPIPIDTPSQQPEPAGSQATTNVS